MKLQIGEKIRELRKRNNKKQEDLACSLGVSPQAISRWEQGIGYPDMEFIPSLANYFHVTIDELFGYDGDRETKINQIISEADSYLVKNKNLNECVNMLRLATDEFPCEPRIWLRFGYALSAYSVQVEEIQIKKSEVGIFVEYDAEQNSQNEVAREAINVLEKVLDMGINSNEKESVVPILITHYATMGMYDKAKELAFKQNSIGTCRELMLSKACCGKERDIYNSGMVMTLLRLLKLSSIWAVGTKYSTRSSEYAVNILLSIANVYKAVIDKNDFGIEHCDLSDIYMVCAAIYARMECEDKALEYIDLAVYHKEAYDHVRTQDLSGYLSELLSSVQYVGKQLPMFTMIESKVFFDKFPDKIKRTLSENEKYAKYFHYN